MTVPVFGENIGRPSQLRQRCVMVLCLMPDWKLHDPQCEQYGPAGDEGRFAASLALSGGPCLSGRN